MFIQIHALQSFPPGNLNRDDRGLPKSALFGGVTRGRISSQCIKRNLRHSPSFAALHNGVAVRTRSLPALVGDALRARASSGMDAAMITAIEIKIKSAFKKESGSEAAEAEDVVRTGQLVFFPASFVDGIATLITEAHKKEKASIERWLATGSKKDENAKKKSAKKGSQADDSEEDSQKQGKTHPLDLAIQSASRLITIDIRMFGRMTTSDLVDDIEAACQVAHAISTHEVRIERDYFTTMDDLSQKSGAGFVGGGDQSTYFNSAVYYRYMNLDLGQMRDVRIDGSKVSGGTLSDSELADAACALLKAGVYAGPTGKQNSFAAHSVPELIVCELSETRHPVSYANAFLEAVKLHGDGSVMSRSALELRTHITEVASRFESPSTRRLALAVGDAKGDIKGARMLGCYADLETALREELLAGVAAGAR